MHDSEIQGNLPVEGDNSRQGHAALRSSNNSLSVLTNRAKARWLKRVMYDGGCTSTSRCLAYLVSDHLNCVTLDAWPSQRTLGALIGAKSIKTISRSAQCLEERGHLRVRRTSRDLCRYAPVFQATDWDSNVPFSVHSCPTSPDNNVHLSSLSIQFKSDPTKADFRSVACDSYPRRRRGELEQELAKMIGRDGWSILEKLQSLDSRHVDRLCGALFNGRLSTRDINAARLAAEYINLNRAFLRKRA